MKNLKPRQADVIKHISQTFGYPMAQVGNVIREYLSQIGNNVKLWKENPSPILTGVLALDSCISLYPGITVVYGHDSSGKTALAKRMAMGARDQYMNVLYWDAENKLFMHDLKSMKGIALANARRAGDLHAILKSEGVDVLVIDTVTSMETRTSIVRNTIDYVPYMILVAQMRENWTKQRSEPACYETTLSTAHTKIGLTSRESVTVESVDMVRVQFKCDKYEADRSKEGTRGSFIIRNGLVDNVYSAYDVLKSRGRISSIGFSKMLDGEDLGGRFRNVCGDKDVASRVIRSAWQSVTGTSDFPEELYIDGSMPGLQDDDSSGGLVDSPEPEGERESPVPS